MYNYIENETPQNSPEFDNFFKNVMASYNAKKTKMYGQGPTQYQHTTHQSLPDSMNQRADTDCIKANMMDPVNLKKTHPWCFDKTGRMKNNGRKPDFTRQMADIQKMGKTTFDHGGDQDYIAAAQQFANQNNLSLTRNANQIVMAKPNSGFKEWLKFTENLYLK